MGARAHLSQADGRAPHIVDRIQAATRLTSEGLAQAIGTTRPTLEKLKGKNRGELVGVNRDPLWTALDAFVAEQIAAMLAIREELAQKLDRDRRRQMIERLRVERR